MWRYLLLCSMILFPTDSIARHYRHHHHYKPAPVHTHHARRSHPIKQRGPVPEEDKACVPVPQRQPWSVWLNTERFHADFESHVYRVVRVRPAIFDVPKPVFDSEKSHPNWVGMLSSTPFIKKHNPTLEQELMALAKRKYMQP